jgi:hypothetical protein
MTEPQLEQGVADDDVDDADLVESASESAGGDVMLLVAGAMFAALVTVAVSLIGVEDMLVGVIGV